MRDGGSSILTGSTTGFDGKQAAFSIYRRGGKAAIRTRPAVGPLDRRVREISRERSVAKGASKRAGLSTLGRNGARGRHDPLA